MIKFTEHKKKKYISYSKDNIDSDNTKTDKSRIFSEYFVKKTRNKFVGDLKIIPLGGLGEVGRNCTVFEYNHNDKRAIIVVDLGFRFPEEDMPGIDFILPNIDYLRDKKDDILGIIITHGHYDHIGAIPYLVEDLGYPSFFASSLTKGIILKRQTEFPHQKKLDITEINEDSKINLGPFKLSFVHVNHNIPDSLAVVIDVGGRRIFHTGDFKFDFQPVNEKPADMEKFKKIGDEGVTLLMADSTNAEEDGHSISEAVIYDNLDEVFSKANGRIIVGTFSSLLNRIQQVITLSEKYGRKVIIEGYSMKSNVEIAKELKYLRFDKKTIINVKDIDDYPPEKITVLGTGAQGESNAVLMRIASGEHKYIKIKKGDTIIFSSSIIPGNERTVQGLKDEMYRKGAKVIHYKMMDIHAGGHARKEDIIELIKLLRPKFFMPIYGQYSMLVANAATAESVGIKNDNILIPENGWIIHLDKEHIWKEKKVVPSNYIMVDGLGVGDVGEVVLRDRQLLSKDGIFVIIVVLDTLTGRVKGSPDIISRGFIYLKESKDFLKDVRKRTINIVEKLAIHQGKDVNTDYIKNNLRDRIGQYLFSKTSRRPMVLPVIIKI